MEPGALSTGIPGSHCADYAGAVMASGFPGIMNAAIRLRGGLLDAYLRRVVVRDLCAVRCPETLR
jgi:hypothetical protein